MKADVLVAEIGSTTTVVNAFELGEHPRLLGQGMHPTTVAEGDVNKGLLAAVDDLRRNLSMKANGGFSSSSSGYGGYPAGQANSSSSGNSSADGSYFESIMPDCSDSQLEPLEYGELMAASSAAGGLSMSVHGLVYDMTARAAKEAALGAGAVVRMVTAGDLTSFDLAELDRIKPKIILLAGGVDFGEKDTAIRNARVLAARRPRVPVIYAGNVAARNEVASIFSEQGVTVHIVENVYPKVDELAVEPARKVIQRVFEDHITGAPGMDKIRDLVGGPILPTPGAVMESCLMLYPVIGDLCALDVGGATTDVHSVAKGSPEIQSMLESPEPLAKRTVEGDLGVHVNAKNIYEQVKERAARDLGFDPQEVLANLKVIPDDERQRSMLVYFARYACETAFSRHVGRVKYLYGPSGRQTVASGKDLSSVRTIIGTGGPLTRLPGGAEALRRLVGQGAGREMYPKDAVVLLDADYIMACCGVLSRKYPAEAKKILMGSLGIERWH